MKHIVTYIVCLLSTIYATAQINISGVVFDKETDEPLTGASVIVKGADGKIRKYATSKAGGDFSISLPSVAGCRLEVSMMSFSKQTISLDSASFPLKIYMEPGSIKLKEVAVKADRIREQGDTITYTVSSFAQSQDRSIGDVLKRMPGISVEKSGKIQYQGEDINKFYIEGSDLLGGKYGIATNGISHEDVGSVEVMENHQPMQVLSGISFSDKAALNLKLKNKSKATWTFHGDAGGGYSWQPEGGIWDGELFAMAVMPNFQNITTLKTNNIGEDLSAQVTDFFSSRRNTGLNRYVGVSLPGVPNLNRKRTLFNRSVLVSTNNLWKLKRGEFKAQFDYSFNRVTADATNVTTYFLSNGERVVTEKRSGVERNHSVSGKMVYELNNRTAFVNNTLKTNINWDDIRLGMTGSLPNDQSASIPDYYVSNKFKIIKRFKGNHLVTFESVNEWESLPQTLNVTTDGKSMRQHVGDHAFYTNESASYIFSINGVTLSLNGGIKGYLRTLNTELPDIPDEIPGLTENVLNTNYVTVYVNPDFEYWIRRVNISFEAPVSIAHYRFDKAIANRSEVYFSPSLHINWKPNNRFSFGLRGGTGRSPMNLNLIQPGFIMTDYRSFRQGVDEFYNSASQNLSVSVSYKHPRHGVFANAYAMQSWTHTPFTLAQQLYGDYIVYSYSTAKNNGKILMTNGSVGKTLDFIRGSASISGRFSRNESHLLSLGENQSTDNRTVNSVHTSWGMGGSINGTPLRWMSFDYHIEWNRSRMTMNSTKASWLENMENELLLNILPHPKWEWAISGEHYRNEITEGNFKNVVLLDTKLTFKLSKRIRLSADLSNVFNRRTYNYTTYNQLNSFESQRRLRGREFLISISLQK
ncbi:MAG: TonB-dependent receptor [Duncaniella sp.]|nr:TonB-dependent receptor [Duncaniella sp.]